MSAAVGVEGIDVDDAVRMAFDHFAKLVRQDGVDRILLEGVEVDETTEDWVITIGFDSGRKRTVREASARRMTPSWATSDLFGEVERTPGETIEPIRELREFRLDGRSGKLKKMRSLTL